MAKFTIEWSEQVKTGETKGKIWAITKMTLKDEEGKITEGVTTFDGVQNGATIEGEIIKNEKYGGYEFKKSVSQFRPDFMKKNAQMEKVMERKETSIGKFQDNKEWSIKVSSTMRDAVLLTIAEYSKRDNNSNGTYTPDFEKSILRWRQWLLENWDVEPTDIPPFK